MKKLLLLALATLVACGDGSTGPEPNPVSIATSSLPDATVGVSYSMALAASGGTGAYAWSISGGALPAGLTLSAGGAISGTPTTAGTATFTVQATSGKLNNTRGLSINVQAPEIVIGTNTLPGGTVGSAYSQSLAASGGSGTYTWAVTGGALPAGLTLSAAGVISGTPSSGGISTFIVQATSGTRTATKSLSIDVAFQAVSVTTATLPDATVGTAYSQTLAATGGTGTYAWGLTSGTLPAGLTLYVSGQISGTPTASGTASFTVQAVSGPQSAGKALTITVQQPPVSITTVSLPNGEVGQAYSQTLAATGGIAGGTFTWSKASGDLPPGVTLSAAGVIAGTPTLAGSYTFSARVVNGGQAEKSFTIVVLPPPVVITSTSPLPAAIQGAPYSQTLTATGGTGSYTWTSTAGTLPAGLSLSSGGVIAGTPTTQGTSTFTVQATSGTRNASKDLTLTVGPPNVTITTTTLPAGVAGDPYSQQLAATGGNGTYSWTLASGSGPLPTGLTLSEAGLISGTPSAQGTFNFTVKVTSAALEATKSLSITIGAAIPAVVVTTTSLPGGNLGETYSASLVATGGTGIYTWALAAGSGPLPGGLTLSTGGLISGTASAQGTFNFTVEAASGGKTGTKSLSITIGGTLPDVVISTTSLPGGTVASAYSQQLLATGGNGTFTWTRISGDPLPAGLSLSSSGLISGTPTAAGTSTFTVQAASGSKSATQQLSITVVLAPVNITTVSPLPNGMVNVAYSRQLAATGGTGSYTWALASGSSLPGGLSLSAGGLISGTPTTAGPFNFTVQATSGAATTAKAFALTIDAVPAVTVTTTTLSNGTVGTAYSKQLTATGGLGTFTWTVSSGTLPDGLSLSSGGLLSGTPTTAGTSNFTVQASSGGQSDTQALALTIDAASGSIITLNVGTSATASVTAGQNLVIPINVDLSQVGTGNLASLTVKISWDTNRFTYVSSSAGNWVDINGDPASPQNNLTTAASGFVTLGGFTTPPTTASFTLRTITLQANATATQVTSPVTATEIVAGNVSGQAVTVTPRNLTATINP